MESSFGGVKIIEGGMSFEKVGEGAEREAAAVVVGGRR